jgi:outer membrane protein OmpA-like peptidoglycan-associated protein
LPQYNSQQPVFDPAGTNARQASFCLRTSPGSLLGALALTAGLLVLPTAMADETSHSADQPAGQAAVTDQTSPLDEELAAKKDATEAAAIGSPDPAPVPEPPEQSSDDETLIQLPIAPAGSRQDESEEALAPATNASDGVAVAIDVAAELQNLRVLFPAGGIGIDTAAESELIRLAGYLNHNQAQRVVLRAHAGDSDQGSSHARRLSLSRALAIRTFLVDRGVPVDRIYLRPLGSEIEDGPPDRVDILPLRP